MSEHLAPTEAPPPDPDAAGLIPVTRTDAPIDLVELVDVLTGHTDSVVHRYRDGETRGKLQP